MGRFHISKMREVGKTMSFDGDYELIPVFECEICGYRTTYGECCAKCKDRIERSIEEAEVGIL